MNNLAFQIYGTKKATPFQSVWKTDQAGVLGSELAAITGTGTNWAPAGTTLVNGGYTHTAGSAAVLQFGLIPSAGQSYQMQYTITGTGSVIINFGGVSSALLTAGTNVIITLTTITAATLSITPVSFVGNISLSIRQSSSATNQIQLPISIAAGKSIWIDWGDNSYTNANNDNIIVNRIHTYTTPGEYAVRILGDNFNFGFGVINVNDRLKIKSISSWGKLKIGGGSFYGCSKVTMSGITDVPDLTGVTNLASVFQGCSLLTTVGRMNEWNTSSVTSMGSMFASCTNFNSDISNWNVSSVTTIADMFAGASNFNQPIGNWERVSSPDTSTLLNCTNAFALFKTASAFNQSIGNWNVSGVTNMLEMFNSASNFNNGFASGVANQLPWTINNTAASVSMASMFRNAISFNSNLGTGTTSWDVSKVTTFADMFNSASNFRNGDEVTQSKINNWAINTGSNVSMAGMFSNALTFNRDVSNWNMTKVTNTSFMFNNATAFNQPLANWERITVGNVSTIGNITNMQSMFQSASTFNQNIGNWNITKVTNFQQMFQSASAFNNNGSSTINNWSINTTLGANVNMNSMFAFTSSFNQPIGTWNVSNVTDMKYMFIGAPAFNQNIGSWNVSKVTDMEGMFSGATSFNQPIGSWDVSQVTDMLGMFYQAIIFNQNIGSWNVSNVTAMGDMFYGATAFNQSLSNWERVSSPDTSTLANVTTMLRMFGNATAFNNGLALGLPSTLTWNTSGVTTMAQMFNNTTAFNCNIGGFNVSNCSSFNFMFRGATRFNNGNNASIGNWILKTTGSIDMGDMFYNATAFNQPLGSWNVSRVTNMFRTFQSATAFNQNIGAWNISNVTNFAEFMLNKTFNDFSSTNLNAIYNGWSALPSVQPNINISFGTIKYTSLGATGRGLLAAPPNGTGTWTIADGGITA